MADPVRSDPPEADRAEGSGPPTTRSSGLTAGPPEGVYLHIPFCVSICPYCDFVVLAGSSARGPRARTGALVAAMHVEIDRRADRLDATFGVHGTSRAPLTSIYIGGGTPSLLPADTIAELISRVEARFGVSADAEITLEANPGADEIGDLDGFRKAGVNRLSIGVQSMAAEQLRELGRRHTPSDVVAAVAAARRAGFADISLDLLTDVPDQDPAGWRETLGAALDLEPDHLSVYALTLGDPDAEGLTGPDGDHLPVSRGARRWRERASARRSQERARAMDDITDAMTEAAGFERYEIANLARPGHRSRHNQLYWRRRPYVGFGPGAHSSDGALRRTWNAAGLEGYVASLAEHTGDPPLPPGGFDVVDPVTARAEAAMLRLRMADGLEITSDAPDSVASALGWARARGLVDLVGGSHVLTVEGRALADEVFMRMLPSADGGAAA